MLILGISGLGVYLIAGGIRDYNVPPLCEGQGMSPGDHCYVVKTHRDVVYESWTPAGAPPVRPNVGPEVPPWTGDVYDADGLRTFDNRQAMWPIIVGSLMNIPAALIIAVIVVARVIGWRRRRVA